VKTTRAVLVTLAIAAGAAVGWRLAGRHLERHKAALFSQSRIRRRAALGYLAGQESAETVRLLRDFIAWEPTAPLRRRAARLARRMELHLT
jgi:hypothetical protein